jgi:hypothetical protein
MARLFCAVCIAFSGLSAAAKAAGPVSYADGVTLIEETDRESTSLAVHYTLNPHFALGYRTEWDRRNDVLLNGARATALLKRWYGENYQANAYLSLDVGVANGVGPNPSNAAPYIGAVFMADWETRRWFASYMAHAYEAFDAGSNIAHMARVGVAPYVADTGALHTWLMVEVDHRPDNPNEIDITPLVRFFKGDVLFEAGWSIRSNQPLVNLIYRF